jgi:hypothetical protein
MLADQDLLNIEHYLLFEICYLEFLTPELKKHFMKNIFPLDEYRTHAPP